MLEAKKIIAEQTIEEIADRENNVSDREHGVTYREKLVLRKEQEYEERIDQRLVALGKAWLRRATGRPSAPEDAEALAWEPARGATEALGAYLEKLTTLDEELAKKAAWLTENDERLTARSAVLNEREHKIDAREDRTATGERALNSSVAAIEEREQALARREEKAADERIEAGNLLEAAKNLLDVAQKAFLAIQRRWRRKPLPDDDALLAERSIAGLVATADQIDAEIKREREELRSRAMDLDVREALLSSRETSVQTDRDELANDATKLAGRIIETIDKEAELKAREDDIAVRERAAKAKEDNVEAREQKTVEADEAARMAKAEAKASHAKARQDAEWIRSIGDALGRRLRRAPDPQDEAILASPEAKPLVEAFRITNRTMVANVKALAEREAKIDEGEKNLGERQAKAERDAALLQSIGHALGRRLQRAPAPEDKEILASAEAKPLVEAFDGTNRYIIAHLKVLEEREAKAAEKEEGAKVRVEQLERRAGELAVENKQTENWIAGNNALAEEAKTFLLNHRDVLEHVITNAPEPVRQVRSELDQVINSAQRQNAAMLERRKRQTGPGRD